MESWFCDNFLHILHFTSAFYSLPVTLLWKPVLVLKEFLNLLQSDTEDLLLCTVLFGPEKLKDMKLSS